MKCERCNNDNAENGGSYWEDNEGGGHLICRECNKILKKYLFSLPDKTFFSNKRKDK